MKDILTVFSKEMRRFFTDRRTLAALFLPGIAIFILYTILGHFISDQLVSINAVPKETEIRVAYTENFGSNEEPSLVMQVEAGILLAEESNTVVKEEIASSQIDEYKDRVRNDEIDLLIVYSNGFEDQLKQEGTGDNSVSLFYNAEDSVSSYVYSLASSLISVCYNNYFVNIIDNEYQNPNLSEGSYALSQMLSFVFPMITIALLFSTILTICPESIAGEKERGTIASLLLTPVKRSHIALGKILALSVTAIASGAVSFLGILLSLPELFGGEVDFFSVFTPGAVVVLFFLIITALFLFVTMGLFVSAFAKTIKEANAYLSPLMIVFMILAIVPAVVDMSNIGIAFIPILDLVVSMNLIITGAVSSVIIPFVAVTIVMNLVLSGLFIFLVTKIFRNENVMFSR